MAEDTPFNQKFIQRLLGRWGHQAVIAENGRVAVEALSKNAFDLLLMDIQMPEMDGLRATALIREKEKVTGDHIPIIALTAHAMKGDRERCLEAGMDEYISKPISPDALLKAIHTLMPAKLEKAAPGVNSHPETGPNDMLNRKALLDAFDNDPNFFKEVVDIFVNDYPAMITTLQESISENDAALMQRTAHSLKGMLRNFQAEAAALKALKLEELGRDGSFTGARACSEELAADLAAIEKRLKEIAEKMDS